MVSEADIAKAQRQRDELLQECTTRGALSVTVATLGEASSQLIVLKSELDGRSQLHRYFSRRFTYSRLAMEVFLHCRLALAHEEEEVPILLVGCTALGSFLASASLLGFVLDVPLKSAVCLSLGFALMVLVGCILIARHSPIDDARSRLASLKSDRSYLRLSSQRVNEASVAYHTGERHRQNLVNLLELKCRLREADERVSLVNQQWAAQLNDRRYKLLNSSDWKSLRGIPFEQFLSEVFEVLGYKVTLTSVTGDQGVDIIASKSDVRLAVQAKGVAQSVGNGAVQEAFAGMKHYRCTHCVVITNSGFTRGARQLARSVDCRLIGQECIADLINGKIL